MKKTVSTFSIQDLLPIGLTLVVVGIALAYGLSVMGDVKTEMIETGTACGTNATGGSGGQILYTNCGADYNATSDAISGVAKVPNKMPLIVTVVIAAVIIGILVRYLFVRFG